MMEAASNTHCSDWSIIDDCGLNMVADPGGSEKRNPLCKCI